MSTRTAESRFQDDAVSQSSRQLSVGAREQQANASVRCNRHVRPLCETRTGWEWRRARGLCGGNRPVHRPVAGPLRASCLLVPVLR